MTQSSCSSPHLVGLDYENTLVLAIELSNVSWVLAAQVPGLLRVKAKQTIEPRTEALWAAINGYRERSRAAGRTVKRVVAIYEAAGVNVPAGGGISGRSAVWGCDVVEVVIGPVG